MSGLEAQFNKFCNFGQTASTSSGNIIPLSNIDKWFKQAGLFGAKLSTTDTAIHFGKLKQKKVNFADFQKFLEDIATTKKLTLTDMKEKLSNCGDPGTSGTTKATTAGGVDRLTDTSKYTGSHKERFDESGKGKGVAGREDVHANDGYVGNYKGKDTYDKK